MHKLSQCNVGWGGFLILGVLAGCVAESAEPPAHLGQIQQEAQSLISSVFLAAG